jgi:hypothetical protein
MINEGDPFRMSDDGLEPLPADDRMARGRPAGTGFGDKKKVAILLVLALVGGALVAWQFLGGGGPKEAGAVTLTDATAAVAEVKDVDSILQQLDGAASAGGGAQDGSVERIEELVKKFDTYVATRQVPLKNLRANPFAVEAQAAPGGTRVEVNGDNAAAKAQHIRDAAMRLVLGSVLVAGNRRMAIISGKPCEVGDVVEGFEVRAIGPDRVRLLSEGQTVDLVLPIGGSRVPAKGNANGR